MSVYLHKALAKMDFEIVTSSKTPGEYFNLITDFWSIDQDNSFSFTLADLATNYELTVSEIKQIIKKFSGVLVFMEHCTLCNSSYKLGVKTRVEFKNLVSFKGRICDLCDSYSPKPLFYNELSKIDIKFRYQEISEMEKFILNGMVNLKSKMLIYKHIFNNNLENKDLWKIINNLERNGLLYIDRNNDCSIKAFRFPSDVLKIIKKKSSS